MNNNKRAPLYSKPSFQSEPKRQKTIGKDLIHTKIEQWNRVLQIQDLFFSQDDEDTDYYIKNDTEPLIVEPDLEKFSIIITGQSSEIPLNDSMGNQINAFLKEEGISVEKCATNEELQQILGKVEIEYKKKVVYSKPNAYPSFENISPPGSPEKEQKLDEEKIVEKHSLSKFYLLRNYTIDPKFPDIGQTKPENIILSLNENFGLDQVYHSGVYYYRDPSFYERDCYIIGLIRVKKHFDKNAAAGYIFIKNIGIGFSSPFPPSIFRLTHEEAEELSENLETLQNEITNSARTEIPRLAGHKPIESFGESF